MLQSDKNLVIADILQPVVCIMAHNEEANIAKTLQSILERNSDVEFSIKVYANGCTDNTHQIVGEISTLYPSVELFEIEQASKANAWNIAFKDNRNKVLIFADGDILPDSGAIREIMKAFENRPDIEIACCKSWPESKGLNWEQRLTGFMQIPIKQDFLIGHFYGIRRSAFISHFLQLGIPGLPVGIAGEDAFLENLVSPDRFIRVNSKVIYQPPVFEDYYKFLARMKWQSEQIQFFQNAHIAANRSPADSSLLNKLIRKIVGGGSIFRLMIGGAAAFTRVMFMKIGKTRIEHEYQKLGPVTSDGSWVLSGATRSASVK